MACVYERPESSSVAPLAGRNKDSPATGMRESGRVTSEGIEVVADGTGAEWIAPRLGGGPAGISWTVPAGYECYARICHPVEDGHGEWVDWNTVAQATGRRAHPLMQWHVLVGSADPLNMRGSLWPGGNPQRGNLHPDALANLCEILAAHIGDQRCFFCVWEGYGWISAAMARYTIAGDQSDPGPLPPPAFSDTELAATRVDLPHRSYLLLTGGLDATLKIGWRLTPDYFVGQSPNLFWPADRSWCVASEIDFDSTLVGGSRQLIDEILAEATLDSWPISPDDSLAYDGDHLNPAP
jgi:hypothetical protein